MSTGHHGGVPDAWEELIVLVDDEGRSIGSMPKRLVHTGETPLHRAFSAYLFDGEGRLLITRRAEDRLRQLVRERANCPVEGALTRYLAEGREISGTSERIAA